MLTALEFIIEEQLDKKNPALLLFHLSTVTPDRILNRVAITEDDKTRNFYLVCA